jgi:hypothetical protein
MQAVWIAYAIIALEVVQLSARVLIPAGVACLVYRGFVRRGRGRAWGGRTVDVLLWIVVAVAAAVEVGFWVLEIF